jgi:hypothetical protein
MLTWLGTVAWAVLLGGPALAERTMSLPGDEWATVRALAQVPGRAAGRVLGCFIRKGMTKEQVERILRGHAWSGSGMLLGNSYVESRIYYAYGLSLGLDYTQRDHPQGGLVSRVTHVYFLPLWDWAP